MADPIRHVVALILENHSFDQMLGCFREVYPKLDGVDPLRPGQNSDAGGRAYSQLPTDARWISDDPHHEVDHVRVQLDGGNAGFVKDFEASYPKSSPQERRYIMGYYPRGSLPALHALAADFTICDRWHCSLPGPTWPNRFFALSGTSSGKTDMPGDGAHAEDIDGYFEQDQLTIFDRLNEKEVSWKVYFEGIPQSIVMKRQRLPQNFSRYEEMPRFYQDAKGPEGKFPAFCLIEPDYMGEAENDDHPPHDVMKAQALLADVYNALRANDSLWKSTLLAVFYDEHGGFYDHVPPPAAVPPDAHAEYPFDRYGVRVPALLVSPWVERGVCSTLFDHTSLLKYLIDKWSLGPLGARAARANNIVAAISSRGAPREDTVKGIRVPRTFQGPSPGEVATAHHQALAMLSLRLRKAAIDDVGGGAVGLFSRIEAGAADLVSRLKGGTPAEIVKDRFRRYYQSRRGWGGRA